MKVKTSFLVFMVMVFLAGFAFAETNVMVTYGEPGYEGVISDTTSSAGFSASNIYKTGSDGRGIPAKAVLIMVVTAGVNFTEDGTTPTTIATTDIGMPIGSGQSYLVKGISAIAKFRCINQVASSGAKVKYRVFF